MFEHRKKVGNIDKYKELAKSKESQKHAAGDISNPEKIKEEKEKVDKEIEKTKKEIRNVTIELNDLRAKLGMPETDDIPSLVQKNEKLSSLLNIQADLEQKLDLEKKKAESQNQENKKNPENQEPQEMKKFESSFRATLEDISNQAKTMLDALYERQQNRLTPIQSNENFQMMISSIRNFKNFDEKVDINSISKITDSINKLSRIFDDIKLQSSRGQINENTQNLEKLAFGAKKFSHSCEDGKNKLLIESNNKELEEKSIEMRKSLQRLSEQAQRLSLFSSKLRSNFR